VTEPEASPHAHEIGERSGSHFLHHIPSMNLGMTSLMPNSRRLFVQEPADHQRQHLPLPGVSAE